MTLGAWNCGLARVVWFVPVRWRCCLSRGCDAFIEWSQTQTMSSVYPESLRCETAHTDVCLALLVAGLLRKVKLPQGFLGMWPHPLRLSLFTWSVIFFSCLFLNIYKYIYFGVQCFYGMVIFVVGFLLFGLFLWTPGKRVSYLHWFKPSLWCLTCDCCENHSILLKNKVTIDAFLKWWFPHISMKWFIYLLLNSQNTESLHESFFNIIV